MSEDPPQDNIKPVMDFESPSLQVTSQEGGDIPQGDVNSEQASTLLDSETAAARAAVEHDPLVDAIDKETLADRIDATDFTGTPLDPGQIHTSEDRWQPAKDLLEGDPAYEKVKETGEGKQMVGQLVYGPGHELNTVKDTETGEPDTLNASDLPASLRGEASKLHEKASRLGDWAEVLTTHPPSAEWQAKYMRIDPTNTKHLEVLISAENAIPKILKESEEIASRPNTVLAEFKERRSLDPNTRLADVVGKWVEWAGSDDDQAGFAELIGREDTRENDILNFFNSMCQTASDARRFAAVSNRDLLEQLKDGRAERFTETAAQS